jgi:hypothetical protein
MLSPGSRQSGFTTNSLGKKRFIDENLRVGINMGGHRGVMMAEGTYSFGDIPFSMVVRKGKPL